MIRYFKNFLKKIRFSLFKFPKYFFTKKPIQPKSFYYGLFNNEKKIRYPIIDKFEQSMSFAIEKEWIDELALHTQIVIKKSKLNYQHGRILYSLLRNYIDKNNINYVSILETGTSRGFSSLCLSKAINDSQIKGKIITFDIIPHNQKMYWNIFKDNEGMFTREELLLKWKNELDNIIFIEGWTNSQIEKTGLFRINFAFLDAQHEYENVMQEFNYVNKRQYKNDIIMFDDVTKNRFDGVCKAVKEIESLKTYSVEYINSSDNRGYAVARKL